MEKIQVVCSAEEQTLVDQIEDALEIPVGDCSKISTTDEGGIHAVQTDALGISTVLEVNNKGDVYYSTYRSEESSRMMGMSYVGPDPSRRMQSSSVSPDKVKYARELILKE